MDYIDSYLEIYSLEQIIELNDLTESEVLEYLVKHNIIELPEVKPL